MLKAAVGQMGSVLFDMAATLDRIEAICQTASAQGVRLLVLPEAILGGYPKGLTFGAVVGSRSEAGREQFLRYTRAALQVPGVETEQLATLSRELSLHLVLGAIERAWGTLYCTALLFTPAINRDGIEGSWVEKDLSFDATLLQAGDNELTLTVPAGGLTSGVSYDVVRLELAGK